MEREKAVILRGRMLDRRCSPVPGDVVDIWYSGNTGGYSLSPRGGSEGGVNFAFGIPLDKDGYLISGVSHF